MNFTFPQIRLIIISSTSSFESPASGSVRRAADTCWLGMEAQNVLGI